MKKKVSDKNKDKEEDQQRKDRDKKLKCICGNKISASPYSILSDFLIRGKIVCDECFVKEKNVFL